MNFCSPERKIINKNAFFSRKADGTKGEIISKEEGKKIGNYSFFLLFGYDPLYCIFCRRTLQRTQR